MKLDFNNLKSEKRYNPASQYYQNKLALLMNSLSLKERLADSNVSVHAVRVTNVKIDINKYQGISAVKKYMYKFKSRFSISPDDMAKVYTALATGPKPGGFLYDEKMVEAKANKFVYDSRSRERLWEICDSLTSCVRNEV
jgi:short-subunit dehydrogenase